MSELHVAVIGKGLIGSAAARHLAEAGGCRVTLIGPDEPADPYSHHGVFAAHYDAARITRTLDSDPVWARWAQAAIGRYPDLEARTGLRFHHGAGFLAAAGGGSDLPAAMDAVAAQLDLPIVAAPSHPFHLAAGTTPRFEPAPAGWIDPRRLVQAQTLAAVAAGVRVVRLPCWALRTAGETVRAILDDGSEVRADRVLVCAGAFAGPTGLAGELPLAANGRIVLLAEVDDTFAHDWPDMPSLIRVDPDAELPDVYLLPPVRYPDGRRYIKIGTGAISHPLDDLETLQRWFREPVAGDDADRLGRALLELLPGLEGTSLRTDVCAVTLTPSGYPIIDWLQPGRIAVACGGNGKAAKSSDELGRIAAMHVMGALEVAPGHEVLRV